MFYVFSADKRSMNEFLEHRWWKDSEVESSWPEVFLKTWEPYCVAACARYLRKSFLFDRMWVLSSCGPNISALLFQSGRTLFPVFGGQKDIRIPPYMSRAFVNMPIYALQGLSEDTDILEEALAPMGFSASEHIDFDLMMLDSGDEPRFTRHPPAGLSLKLPEKEDFAQMLALHAAYEQEEVLPAGSEFNLSGCRTRIIHILRNERVLAAQMDGRLVGKINTNATSFSRYQIGGVYVAPAYRGLGIGRAMTAAFVRLLLAAGKGVSLFVKKHNGAAQAVYRDVGFSKAANYCISYMRSA